MSSSTSAIKASKSIVESYISSNSEKSDLTTSFTSHSSETDVDIKANGIMFKIINYVQHPKFKWVVIAILLCIFAFVYFKTQSKPVKKDAKSDAKKDNLNVRLNKNGHPELVEKEKPLTFGFKDPELQQKIEQLDNKQQQFFMKQMQQQMQMPPQQMQMPQQHNHMAPPQHHQHQVPQPVSQQKEETDSSEESEEVFIENENIMNHNLTMEEMNAIDKQLEDVLD
uniref:Uncharacterized protein n=1 Tax=viral metagenome TaxID=1070528 RepID=A0A6C0HV89_9ZZZZ